MLLSWDVFLGKEWPGGIGIGSGTVPRAEAFAAFGCGGDISVAAAISPMPKRRTRTRDFGDLAEERTMGAFLYGTSGKTD